MVSEQKIRREVTAARVPTLAHQRVDQHFVGLVLLAHHRERGGAVRTCRHLGDALGADLGGAAGQDAEAIAPEAAARAEEEVIHGGGGARE